MLETHAVPEAVLRQLMLNSIPGARKRIHVATALLGPRLIKTMEITLEERIGILCLSELEKSLAI